MRSGAPPPPCPEAILALIPWYPELDDDDRGFIEAHAAECASCRSELEMIAGGPVPTAGLPDQDRLFSNVLARIEAGEERDRLRTTPPRPERVAPRARPWAWVAAVPLLLGVGALGGQLVRPHAEAGTTADQVGGMGGIIETGVVGRGAHQPQDMATAGRAAAPTILIEVVFRPGVEAVHIERSLRAVGGNIVSGPSPTGRFRVALPARSDAVAVAAWMRDRVGGIASLAEPATD